MTDTSIESMPLYTNLERIGKGLAALGISPTDPIRPEQLFPFDQWHVGGTSTVQRAAEQFGLKPASQVLDIGSGLGGPARFLAYTTGCHVTALELQPKINAIASNLTQRCGLSGRVTHLCGDALSHPIPDAGFDAVVSWYAIHHIPNRPRLCARLARALRPGGGCYIEDLYMRSPLASQDARDVRDILIGNSVTSIDEFSSELRHARFVQITASDFTDVAAPLAVERLAMWRKDRAKHVLEYGEEAYAALDTFYALTSRLYADGHLGLTRLVAYAP